MKTQKFILKHLFMGSVLAGVLTSSCFGMFFQDEEQQRGATLQIKPPAWVVQENQVPGLNNNEHKLVGMVFDIVNRNFREVINEIKEILLTIRSAKNEGFLESKDYFVSTLRGHAENVLRAKERDHLDALDTFCRNNKDVRITPGHLRNCMEFFSKEILESFAPHFLNPLNTALASPEWKILADLCGLFTVTLERFDFVLMSNGIPRGWSEDFRPFLFPGVKPIKKEIPQAASAAAVSSYQAARPAAAPIEKNTYDRFMETPDGNYFEAWTQNSAGNLPKARGNESIMFYWGEGFRLVLQYMLESNFLNNLTRMHGIEINISTLPELERDDLINWGTQTVKDLLPYAAYEGGLKTLLAHNYHTYFPVSPRTAFLKLMNVLHKVSQKYPNEQRVKNAVSQAFAFIADQQGACAAGAYARGYLLSQLTAELLVNGLKTPFQK